MADPAGAMRRRANFFRGTANDPGMLSGHDREYLTNRARGYLRAALQALAQAKGVTLQSGQLDDLVQRSGIDGLSTRDLAALSPTSGILNANAEGAFQKAFTPADIERLKLEQQKAAMVGTGFAPTDEQLQRGERPGASPIDALMRYGGRAGTASGSGSRSSADYTGTAIQTYTAISYQGSSFDRMGMTFQTFSALRGEGFTGTNIMRAAEDSKINGFSPSNTKIARSFAVLDRDDAPRREARNRQLQTFRDRLEQDEEIKRLKAERDKATTTPEQRQAYDEQIFRRGQDISRETGTRQFLDAAPTDASRKAGRTIETETIKIVTGISSQLRAEVGNDAVLAGTTADNVRIAQFSVGQEKGVPPIDGGSGERLAAKTVTGLQQAAAPSEHDAIMGGLAALDTKPATTPAKAADASQAPGGDTGNTRIADAGNTSPSVPGAATGIAPAPTSAPVQTADAKPANKPKAPGATMST